MFRTLLLRDCRRLPALILSHLLHNRYIDYYEILGVDRYADNHTIKLGYFKMAKKFHPDTNKNLDAKQMFELVAEAYDVLSDEKRRAEYDETGQASERFGGRADGPQRQASDSTYTAEQMYSKIFNTEKVSTEKETPREDFAVNYSGEDISREHIARISFEESITGTNVCLHLRVAGTCNKCMGSRAEMGYMGRVCPYCEGTGEETVKTGHIIGRKQCSYCNGDKIFYKYKCTECEGIGRILYDRPYFVEIPPGSVNGEVLRFEIDHEVLKIPLLEDEVPPQRVVYVTLKVEDSLQFSRSGLDIRSFIRLSPGLALLGGTIDYEGLTRNCDLKIPSGTSSHATIVLNRAGVHSPGGGYVGDHQLITVLKVPKKLGWRQRRIFRRFAAMDIMEYGITNGIDNTLDHKYTVNVLEPDSIQNTALKGALFNETKEKWYKELYRKAWKEIDKIFGYHI